VKKIAIIMLSFTLFFNVQNAGAHSGRTDGSGGHKCSDKSRQKGLCTGYHYHNGGSSSKSGSSNNSSNKPSTSSYTYKLGSKGSGVKSLQNKLISKGYLKGRADGNFGKVTEAAVKKFQKANGLKADGIAGATTLKKLGLR